MRVGNLQDGSMLSTLGDNEGIMLFAGVALNAINAIWGAVGRTLNGRQS